MQAHAQHAETLFDASSIRIVLVPVGNIGEEQFAHYAETIRAMERVPLTEVSPPGDFSRTHGELRNMPWLEGMLHLRFENVTAVSDPWHSFHVRAPSRRRPCDPPRSNVPARRPTRRPARRRTARSEPSSASATAPPRRTCWPTSTRSWPSRGATPTRAWCAASCSSRWSST